MSATRKRLDLKRNFTSLADLQAHTDQRLDRDVKTRKCPVTGKSVLETWQDEAKLLRPLPATLPDVRDRNAGRHVVVIGLRRLEC